MIEFFMAMKIPNTTHQMKQVAVVNGKPHFYEPQDLQDARKKFKAYLGMHRPSEALTGAVRLVTKWVYASSGKHPADTWKTTRPDTDNMVKLLKDCMTAEGFWKDDAQVASEITEKFYGQHEGIYVKVEEI